MTQIKMKRIYDEKESADGFRVLADRLWPRGLSKKDVKIDVWAKEIAPSSDLRKWYHAHMDKYDEFYKRYTHELKQNPETAEFTKLIRSKPTVTLLTAAKEISKSELGVLKDYIKNSS